MVGPYQIKFKKNISGQKSLTLPIKSKACVNKRKNYSPLNFPLCIVKKYIKKFKKYRSIIIHPQKISVVTFNRLYPKQLQVRGHFLSFSVVVQG